MVSSSCSVSARVRLSFVGGRGTGMAGITDDDIKWALDEASRLRILYEDVSNFGHHAERGSMVPAGFGR